MPERAVEKIPQDIADRPCIFHKLSAVRHRKAAGATSCLEISRSSVGVLGEEAYALAAGALSGRALAIAGLEARKFPGGAARTCRVEQL